MHIVLVAQGSLPIPPQGWGAVEHILWEYATRLRANGHRVTIVNRKWRLAGWHVAWLVRTQKVDVVHVHQERALRLIVPWVGARALVVATSHAPLDREQDRPDSLEALDDLCLASYHLALHAGMADLIKSKRPDASVVIQPNGAETEKFRFAEQGNGKIICLGKLQARKRQRELAERVECDFIGPVGDEDLAPEHQHMKKGAWDRDQVTQNLTEYSVLALVSHAEGQPLVVAEALSAGLCVVVSPDAAQNLDLAQPFVFLADGPDQWAEKCQAAVAANSMLRHKARAYAEANFSYNGLVARYVQQLAEWLDHAHN